jgi:NADH dehydrogenase
LELIRGPLTKDYHHLDMSEVRIILVEGADNLLLSLPDSLGHFAIEHLQQMDVEVQLGALVSEVTAVAVKLNDGSLIPTETAVWTAGVGGEGIGRRSQFEVLGNGRVAVRPTLQLPYLDNIFAIGDLAAFQQDDGSLLPMVAPVAMQQGELAAVNIQNLIAKKVLRPFAYKDKGSMAVIGRNAAVAQIGKRAFTGYFAWLIWLAVHLVQLMGFRNRVFVLLEWAWNYLFFEKTVRFILSDKVSAAIGEQIQESNGV